MGYMPDGSVISKKIPVREKVENAHHKLFGLYRGTIVRVMDPKKERVIDKTRVEYVVKVNGFNYPNAVNFKTGGGIYNYAERIRKPQERAFQGELNEGTYDENADGEIVYVLFLEGYANTPIIIGAAEHPRRGSYKPFDSEGGLYDVKEFNGVEFLTDKDSNYTIRQVGRKDLDGEIVNTEAVDSTITMHGNGDIEMDTHGTGGTADLRMKFTKEDKKMEFYAQENLIIMDENGICIQDKFGNFMKLEDGSVTVTSLGDTLMNADGDHTETVGGDKTEDVTGDYTVNSVNATVNASGDATITGTGSATFEGTGGTNVGSAAAPTNVLGAIVNLAGGGAPVARLGDMAIGTGNHGAPVVSNIAQGSPKVTSG